MTQAAASGKNDVANGRLMARIIVAVPTPSPTPPAAASYSSARRKILVQLLRLGVARGAQRGLLLEAAALPRRDR